MVQHGESGFEGPTCSSLNHLLVTASQMLDAESCMHQHLSRVQYRQQSFSKNTQALMPPGGEGGLVQGPFRPPVLLARTLRTLSQAKLSLARVCSSTLRQLHHRGWLCSVSDCLLGSIARTCLLPLLAALLRQSMPSSCFQRPCQTAMTLACCMPTLCTAFGDYRMGWLSDALDLSGPNCQLSTLCLGQLWLDTYLSMCRTGIKRAGLPSNVLAAWQDGSLTFILHEKPACPAGLQSMLACC